MRRQRKDRGLLRLLQAQRPDRTSGVMIPVQNEQHLMLSHEVTEAVKKGKFHIWSISTIDEGIEILDRSPGRNARQERRLPEGKRTRRVQAALEDWLERSYRYKKVISDRIDPPKKKESGEKIRRGSRAGAGRKRGRVMGAGTTLRKFSTSSKGSTQRGETRERLLLRGAA